MPEKNKARPENDVLLRRFFAHGSIATTNNSKLIDVVIAKRNQLTDRGAGPSSRVMKRRAVNADNIKRKTNRTPGGYFCSLILVGCSVGLFHFLDLVGVFLCQVITVLLLVGLEPVTQAV